MPPTRRFAALTTLAAACVFGAPAHAQLRGLPSLPSLPTLPSLPNLPAATERPLRDTLSRAGRSLDDTRSTLVRDLLREHASRLEREPGGELIVRGELVLASPTVATLDAAQAAGFEVAREELLEPLGLQVVVLRPPRAWDTATARRRLHELSPEAIEDFNHLYLPAGTAGGAAPASAPTPAAPSVTAAAAASIRVGLVDGGVDIRHPALRKATVTTPGCGGRARPDAHGTAVASLLVGDDGRFRGAAPGAALYAADIYCGSLANGSVDAVVRALAWLAQQRVPVVNLSIVGPPNRLLEQAVRAMLARGHVLVAAVGNDGPAAAPLYPAAYPGVLGVTGVDIRRRALPEAAQGPQVRFAAPGADLAAASLEGAHYQPVRGTSYAAPMVAGLLARGLQRVDPQAARDAVATLSAGAMDLGTPGRDTVYGEGLVGEDLRVDLARLRGR